VKEVDCEHCKGTGSIVQGAGEEGALGCCVTSCQWCDGTGKVTHLELNIEALDPKVVSKAIKESDIPNIEQGKKFDGGKLRWALLPIKPVQEIIKVLMFGASKYGPNNWQNLDNGKERYYEAAQRHMTAYWEGEKLDEESGKSHLAHAGCCILFMLWLELKDKVTK